MLDLRSNYPPVGWSVERIDPPTAPFRIYKANGKSYPSVTTVLGETRVPAAALIEWQKRLGPVEADRVLRQAGRDGTRVHKMFEGIFTGVPEKPNMPDDLSTFYALNKLTDRVQEVWASELQLFSDELRIAGTCDWCGIFDGIPSMIDLKTAKREMPDLMAEDQDYWNQLGIYARMFQQKYNKLLKRLVIIQIPQDRNEAVILHRENTLDIAAIASRRKEFYSKFGV